MISFHTYTSCVQTASQAKDRTSTYLINPGQGLGVLVWCSFVDEKVLSRGDSSMGLPAICIKLGEEGSYEKRKQKHKCH